MNTFWKWLAGKLPRMLVFYAVVRVMADKIYPDGTIEIDEKKTIEKLRHWYEYTRDRRVWWHSQNLTDGKQPTWKHGRAWLHTWRPEWRLEWAFLKMAHHCTLEINIGGEDDIQLSIGIPCLFDLYFTVGRLFPYSWLPRDWRRSTGIRIFEGYIWLNLWNDNSWGGHGKPWWQERSINVPDLLLGQSKCTSRDLSITDNAVTLPEASYPVKVRMFESTWKRPRWPKITRIVRADVTPLDERHGIPAHAGKGENSWDLDDDAVFGMTLPADTPDEAVKKFAASILRDRQKYGMPTLKEVDL